MQEWRKGESRIQKGEATKFEGLNTKRTDGGGRAGRCPTADLEMAENRGQLRHGRSECISDDRYGNADQ
eukprot:3518097-Heterocapsa_arctica.AAC.1